MITMKSKKRYTNKIAILSLVGASLLTNVFAQAEMDTTAVSQAEATTSVSTETQATKRQIKQAVSKLSELPIEKRSALETLPLAKTTFTAIELLLAASLQSETLISKVDSYIATKKASGTNTSPLELQLETSRNTLEAANISISMASSMTEVWANTLSTTTYKKAVVSKKRELRASLDNARQNIHKTNDTLRNILSFFVVPVTPLDQGAPTTESQMPAMPLTPYPNTQGGDTTNPPTPSPVQVASSTSTSTPPKRTILLEQ